MSLTTRLTGNLNRRLGDLSRIQTQLATGEKINVAGDDPLAANRILAFKNALAETRQLTRNAEDAVAWLQSTDLALGDALNVMQRVRELALMTGGVTDPSSRLALATELEQIHEHLLTIANASFDGERYLFAGNLITQRPFVPDGGGGILYQGDNESYNFEVVRGTVSEINITGGAGFGSPDLFNIISDLGQVILNNDPIDPMLVRIDDGIDNIIQQRAICGARMNRFEMTLERYADEDLNFTALMSYTQDIDLAETLMKYAMMENTYQAALATSAKALQPTLLDYIR